MANPLLGIDSGRLYPPTHRDEYDETFYPDAGGHHRSAISSYSPGPSISTTCPNMSRELLGEYLALPQGNENLDSYYSAVQKALAKLKKTQAHSPCNYINDVLEFTKIHNRFSETPLSRTEFLFIILSIIKIESSGSIKVTGSSGNGLMQIILRYAGSSLFLIAKNNGGQLPAPIVEFYASRGLEPPSLEALQQIRNDTVRKRTRKINRFAKEFRMRELLAEARPNVILGTSFLGFLLDKKRGEKPISVRSAIYCYNGSDHASKYAKEVMAEVKALKISAGLMQAPKKVKKKPIFKGPLASIAN